MSTAVDFLRRAAGGVSSKLAQASSTVTSAAQDGKRYDASNDVLEKCTLTVECTPRKDAMTTAAMAIKSGNLMKRNEQGQWQRRYICAVPHLFLYYFDSETSESPRSVVDLELYNNVSRYKDLLTVAATNNVEKMRPFHFQSEDSEDLNDWLTHFMRDRYFAVRDERNAYQQMQAEMTAVLDTIASQTKAVENEKEIVEKQLEEALLAKQQALAVLHSMLAIVGITEEESARLNTLDRLAHCLESSITGMKRELETKYFGPDEVLEAEKAAHIADVTALQEAVALEVRARKNVEVMLLKAKKAAELQEKEFQGQIDTFQLNFQMLGAAKAESDAKSANLADQKKLLVKEIKRLRAQLTETETNLENVSAVNDKFTQSVVSLQTHLRTAEVTISDLRNAALTAEQEYVRREQAAVTAAVVTALNAVSKNAHNQRSVSSRSDNDTSVNYTDGDAGADPVVLLPASADLPVTQPTDSDSEVNPSKEPALGDEADNNVDAFPTETPTAILSVDAPAEVSSGAPAEAAVLSAKEVQSVLEESQAIMASLRPLPGASGLTRKHTGSGTLSTSNSGNNLRDRRNSNDSAHSGSVGSGLNNCPSSPQDLRDLGWLSPEQERLVDKRQQQMQAQHHAEVEPQYRYLSSSNITAVDGNASDFQQEESGADASSDAGSVGSGAQPGVAATSASSSEIAMDAASSMAVSAASAASAAAAHSMSMFSGTMSLLRSTASSMQGGGATTEVGSAEEASGSSGSGLATGAGKQTQRGILSSMFMSGSSAEGGSGEGGQDDPERLPSAMRLTCLRCSGTVEGPKYSTCKCPVAALVPEDLSSTASGGVKISWGFTEVFTKSSLGVLKEGLAKASQVTAQMAKAAAALENGPPSEVSSGVKNRNTEGFLYYNTIVSSNAALLSPPGGSAEARSAVEGENAVSPEKELWGYFTGTAPVLGEKNSEDAAVDTAEYKGKVGGSEAEAAHGVEEQEVSAEENDVADAGFSVTEDVAVVVANVSGPDDTGDDTGVVSGSGGDCDGADVAASLTID